MKHRAKKSLGQNFLKSSLALRKIVEAGEISKSDTILEIGPGKGALTEQLLGSRCKVLAVEKDKELYELLKEKFKKEILSGQLNLIHDDILNFNTRTYKLETRTYKLIANIPYNITGAILKKFLTSDRQPERMVLMVQKEVAERIVAKPFGHAQGKESLLSISVKAYGEPKIIMKVPARYFSPSPDVDSAIISIKNISKKFFTENNISEEKFWQIVRKGFAHKRKKLSSNLKEALPKEKLQALSLADKRAEDLSLSNWLLLSK